MKAVEPHYLDPHRRRSGGGGAPSVHRDERLFDERRLHRHVLCRGGRGLEHPRRLFRLRELRALRLRRDRCLHHRHPPVRVRALAAAHVVPRSDTGGPRGLHRRLPVPASPRSVLRAGHARRVVGGQRRRRQLARTQRRLGHLRALPGRLPGHDPLHPLRIDRRRLPHMRRRGPHHRTEPARNRPRRHPRDEEVARHPRSPPPVSRWPLSWSAPPHRPRRRDPVGAAATSTRGHVLGRHLRADRPLGSVRGRRSWIAADRRRRGHPRAGVPLHRDRRGRCPDPLRSPARGRDPVHASRPHRSPPPAGVEQEVAA